MCFIMNQAQLLAYKELYPKLSKGCFVASGAQIIGDVMAKEDTSFWFNCVVRADCHYIKIGSYSNIQDCTVIHVTPDTGPVNIGDFVTIGHNAVIHGCIIENNVVIGMKAVILDNAHIRENTFVAAGSVVTPNKAYPPGVLIMGVPAKVVRELTEKEIENIKTSALHYVEFKNNFICTYSK